MKNTMTLIYGFLAVLFLMLALQGCGSTAEKLPYEEYDHATLKKADHAEWCLNVDEVTLYVQPGGIVLAYEPVKGKVYAVNGTAKSATKHTTADWLLIPGQPNCLPELAKANLDY